jgi:hypothetical protein
LILVLFAIFSDLFLEEGLLSLSEHPAYFQGYSLQHSAIGHGFTLPISLSKEHLEKP